MTSKENGKASNKWGTESWPKRVLQDEIIWWPQWSPFQYSDVHKSPILADRGALARHTRAITAAEIQRALWLVPASMCWFNVSSWLCGELAWSGCVYARGCFYMTLQLPMNLSLFKITIRKVWKIALCPPWDLRRDQTTWLADVRFLEGCLAYPQHNATF
jgi:hypothetical protein